MLRVTARSVQGPGFGSGSLCVAGLRRRPFAVAAARPAWSARAGPRVSAASGCGSVRWPGRRPYARHRGTRWPARWATASLGRRRTLGLRGGFLAGGRGLGCRFGHGGLAPSGLGMPARVVSLTLDRRDADQIGTTGDWRTLDSGAPTRTGAGRRRTARAARGRRNARRGSRAAGHAAGTRGSS